MTGLWVITGITTYQGRGSKVGSLLDGLGLLAVLMGLGAVAGLTVVAAVYLVLIFIGVLP